MNIVQIICLIVFAELLRVHAERNKKWTYYPQGRKVYYGIVTGGTSNKVSTLPMTKPLDVMYSICLAHLYARRHGYAFYFEPQLEYVNNRSYDTCTSAEMSAWNKIPLLAELIDDVEVILWLDLDAIINENSFMTSLDMFLPPRISSQSECFPRDSRSYADTWRRTLRSKRIKKRGGRTESDLDLVAHRGALGGRVRSRPLADLPGATARPFLWVTQDQNPDYALNVNTAVLGLRRGPEANVFLKKVWATGSNATYFTRCA